MKILFVLGSHNPFPGAGWARIGFLAVAWSNNHAVEVLGSFTAKSLQKRGTKKIGNLRVSNLIFTADIFNPFFFIISSLQSFVISTILIVVKKPNIAIVSMPPEEIGLGSALAFNIFRTKYIIDYRDEFEDHAIFLSRNKIEKFFYSALKKFACLLYLKSQCVVTVTLPIKEALMRRGVNNVRLIPNGADVKAFIPMKKKKIGSIFKIFYSGGIGEYYRLDIVVKSLKILLKKGVKDVVLSIAGSGNVRQVFDLANQLGIANNVKYLGIITDKTKLAQLASEADVGVIPYDDNPLWKNALPAKFFEYCACGLPVIATVYDDSLLGKLIRDNAVGIISPPLDDVMLAEAFYYLYFNKSFREAAAGKARILIEEKFDRNKIAVEYLSLIKGI